MMTAHTRRTPHHQPNNLASMVPVNEQELSSNNLRHRMMDEFLELLEMMQDELQEWKSMPDSPASSLPPGPRSGRPCMSLLPGVKCGDKVVELSGVRKRKSAAPRELRAGPGLEREAMGPTAKRPRREGSAEAEKKEEGQRQSVPRPDFPSV